MKVIMIMILMLLVAGSIDAKTVQRRGIPPVAQLRPVDQSAIIKRLDDQLNVPVESAWNDRINDIFDLAQIDRELARDYFLKMRSKMGGADVQSIQVEEKGVTTLPAGEPMKRATKPAPSRKPAVQKEESTGTSQADVPSGEEMKKGSLPAPKKGAPRGGPAKNIGGVTKPGEVKPVASTKAAPKPVEQIFSKLKLEQLDNDKLLELFNDLLQKLGTVGTNWNNTIVEKVEEKTKYGHKIYNVYGAPVSKWTNDMGTLKKALIAKNVMPEADITQKIADRISQVRAEKAAKSVTVNQPEEKPKEELTEEDLVKLIKVQLFEPKSDQIGWVVSIKGNIKALDKLNHDLAMQYHDQFIKITKEKPFLK